MKTQTLFPCSYPLFFLNRTVLEVETINTEAGFNRVNKVPMFTKLNPTYQPGGSLTSDAPTYVVRQAGTELYEGLLALDYCYVLNARQMGKSSLQVRTMDKLQTQGFACAEIKFSGIGTQQITASQ
jgi:hypothetical protein